MTPLPSFSTQLPLIVCVQAQDAPGIVAAVSSALASSSANIVDTGQHSDTDENGAGYFAARLEATGSVDLDALGARLTALEERFPDSRIEVISTPQRPRTVLACSSQLHVAADVLARSSIGELNCEIVAVVSDRTDAEPLARRHHVPFLHLPVGAEREDQEVRFAAALSELDAQLVVLARYMRILPSWIVERFENKIINIHHSFLPAFPGARPYSRAHERGVKLIGATAHYVTADLDAGPIIAQGVVHVTHRDSSSDLARRGADVERATLATALRLHLEHRVAVYANKTCIFD